MQGDARDRIPVDLEQVVVANTAFDFSAGSFDQFLRGHGFLGQLDKAADVLLQAFRICWYSLA